MPTERIRICHRFMKPLALTVDVLKKPHARRAYYNGLMVCGSIWMCAVCAARITEVRRQELTAALAASDFMPVLVTYTLSHQRGDKLATVLGGMLNSYRKMKGRRDWTGMVADFGWAGSVRSLEVTYGLNGWHPHIHELVLLPKNTPQAALHGLRAAIIGKWGNALRAGGFNASWAFGVDLRAADRDVQEYVAKFGHEPVNLGWSVEHELTKSPTKKAKQGGRTPMQLLFDYAMGDKLAGGLWQEYARVFKGRKQLVWSRGLRDLLGLGIEQPDELVAESVPDDAVLLASLTPEQWRTIMTLDQRAELLDAASTLDADDFAGWLADVLAELTPA